MIPIIALGAVAIAGLLISGCSDNKLKSKESELDDQTIDSASKVLGEAQPGVEVAIPFFCEGTRSKCLTPSFSFQQKVIERFQKNHNVRCAAFPTADNYAYWGIVCYVSKKDPMAKTPQELIFRP